MTKLGLWSDSLWQCCEFGLKKGRKGACVDQLVEGLLILAQV